MFRKHAQVFFTSHKFANSVSQFSQYTYSKIESVYIRINVFNFNSIISSLNLFWATLSENTLIKKTT